MTHNTEIEIENTNIAERSVRRSRVLMKAKIVAPGGEQQVRVRDLSVGGAHVIAPAQVSCGSDVVFSRGDVFIAANVSWTKASAVGLKFYRTLSDAELAALLPSVADSL